MSFKIINVQHRRCAFTTARELHPLFLNDRSFLNYLFYTVYNVVTCMFHKNNKSELFTPSFIRVLHTFSKDLKRNPISIVSFQKAGLEVLFAGITKNTSTINYCVILPKRPFEQITFQNW